VDGAPALDQARVKWIAEQSLRGASVEDIVRGLVADGVDPASVWPQVAEVLRSPILAAARTVVARGLAVEQGTRLDLAMNPEPIAVRTEIDEAVLYRDHWIAHRPVVLRGAAAAWPAARWTFAELRERFRYAPIDVLVRRPGWWHEPRETRRMQFGDLVDLALGPPSDLSYCDGRTNLLEQAAMVPLRADLGLLPGLVGDGRPRAWVGPAGTITPTHHDQSSAWFVQLVGRKVVYLASPLEAGLSATTVGLYNDVDPREPAPAGELEAVRWHRVELGPSDAVLTPVGWWHHVEALDPSISVCFSGFRWPNAFPWYLPGGAGLGDVGRD
jgi:hypothetical protein